MPNKRAACFESIFHTRKRVEKTHDTLFMDDIPGVGKPDETRSQVFDVKYQ